MDGALRLANAWQRGFPLAPRPFAEIGFRHKSSEETIIGHFRSLKNQGILDRIGPVFRPNVAGASTLAAMAVPEGDLERVAALVSRHEGVNHNYRREHRFNLWFVVTGPDERAVQCTLSRIEHASGLRALRLPLAEEYHIDLGFDLETHAAPRGGRTASTALSAEERKLVRHFAPGLPLVPRPYAELGLDEQAAIATLGRWLEAGVVRRVGAVVRHRRLGYTANAMVVWDVPESEVAALGRRAASDPAVTLCYRRVRALPEWPYNLYCMVHGRERAHVLHEVNRLSAQHGLDAFPRAVLFSTRCFGQRAARYG